MDVSTPTTTPTEERTVVPDRPVKKPCLLSEKQREALAKGRALKLEMNQARKRAKVEKTSVPAEESINLEGVEETKENVPPPLPVLKREKVCDSKEREVQDDDLSDYVDTEEEDNDPSTEEYATSLTDYPIQTARKLQSVKKYATHVNVRERRQPFFV